MTNPVLIFENFRFLSSLKLLNNEFVEKISLKICCLNYNFCISKAFEIKFQFIVNKNKIILKLVYLNYNFFNPSTIN